MIITQVSHVTIFTVPFSIPNICSVLSWQHATPCLPCVLHVFRPVCISLAACLHSDCLIPDTRYLAVSMLSMRMQICLHACLFASLPAQLLLYPCQPVSACTCLLPGACLLNCPSYPMLGQELPASYLLPACQHAF